MRIETKVVSSLEKVFWDEDLKAAQTHGTTALRGERINFQIACRSTEQDKIPAAAQADAPLGTAEIYEVGVVPVTLPANPGRDEHYLRTAPGLFPDPLYPHAGEWIVLFGQWRCLWVSLVIPEDAPAGKSAVTVRLHAAGDREDLLDEVRFTVEVLPARLPEQTLLHTQWFHCDCIATRYKVPVFSEEHWSLLGRYMKNAAEYGVNLLLTPVFTPPLDTQVGGERPTVQLTDVTAAPSGYTFGFDRLERYMALAEACGIRLFEISHLFTQWGAAAAPKIVARTADGEKRIFGWDTDAGSPEYTAFLRAFLRELRRFLVKTGREDRCWFHISDEPGLDMLDSYKRAKAIVSEELAGLPVMDALSNYEFYESGAVEHPVPAIDHIGPFLEHGVEHLWTYYCCCQGVDVSNRFMAMPSCRNRILGWQLFKYNMEGFLQWGYNFWYSQHSRREINPFTETSAGDAFPAGDAYMVYPGEDGYPIPSIRQLVFFETLQDMRALQLLASLSSRDDAVELLDSHGTVGMNEYPRTADWLLSMRETVNRRIAALQK